MKDCVTAECFLLKLKNWAQRAMLLILKIIADLAACAVAGDATRQLRPTAVVAENSRAQLHLWIARLPTPEASNQALQIMSGSATPLAATAYAPGAMLATACADNLRGLSASVRGCTAANGRIALDTWKIVNRLHCRITLRRDCWRRSVSSLRPYATLEHVIYLPPGKIFLLPGELTAFRAREPASMTRIAPAGAFRRHETMQDLGSSTMMQACHCAMLMLPILTTQS